MKFRRENGLWIIEDRGVIKIFETSYDAWTYVFLVKEIRPKPPRVNHSLYPVRTLNPIPERRRKNVAITGL